MIKKILAYDLYSPFTDSHWNVITKTTCKFWSDMIKWHSGRNVGEFRPYKKDEMEGVIKILEYK